MYRLIVFFALVFIVFTSYGQMPGFKAVSNTADFRSRFKAESSKILSISSDFTQEKELIALTEKITSKGKFWFKRSNKVRIDYLKPFVYRLVINGDKILVRDDQKENRFNARSSKLFQQVNQIMVDCMQGTILESKDFSTRIFDDEKTYLLEIVPLGKSLQEFFTTIYLFVDKNDYSVNKLEMNEPGGDKTTLTFSNKVLNDVVKDDIFAL